MTEPGALAELLARIGARRGAVVQVDARELAQWPRAAVAAMQQSGLLQPSSPARSVECPGCERQCTMPVRVLGAPGAFTRAFVACDKRDDISTVAVDPLELEQWQSSAEAVAVFIAAALDIRRPDGSDAVHKRWSIGLLKGKNNSSHLTVVADGVLRIDLAGHSVPVTDLLEFKGARIVVDRRALLRRVESPAAGGADVESAAARRERIKKLVEAERAKGNRAFLKAVAEAQGISITRLKQLLD